MLTHSVSPETFRLLAMFMHEFQTPLTSVKGYAQLLQRGSIGTNGDASRYGGVIVDQTNRAIRILQDSLLAVSAASGMVPLEFERVPLAPLAAQAVQQNDETGEQIHVEIPADLVVRADKRCLQAALTNLLATVIKYSPGANAIRLGAENRGKQVRIWLRIDGPGIAASKWQHVLTDTESVDDYLVGSGLGFYLSRLLVEAQGGTIEVRAEDDSAHEFAFRL